MLRSNTFATNAPGTISLEISDPVLMLNEVAKRYETTERVLMEYVDNALDDAEALYRQNGAAYPYPVRIDITIDRVNRAITVLDNCRGMTRDTLERVVRNVGESQKRGQTWVNGRFGFGVHAFRAAAETLSFQTKQANSSFHALSLQRGQHRGIKEAKRQDEPFPTDSGTGCLVTVAGFDRDWFSSVTVDSIKAEIENHFERLIARPGLHITVGEAGQTVQQCRPYPYAEIDGIEIQQTLQLEYKDAIYPAELVCKIAAQPLKRPVSFFARGRRISEVNDIKSFMRKSVHKTSVWSHPHLIGYIEVGEIVQPIINRDDFVRTHGRAILYEALLPVEAQIKSLLTAVNAQWRENTFAQFEQVVQRALTVIVADRPDFTVQFGEDGNGQRVWLENGRLTINIRHPDFQARLRTSRQGNPRPSDRMNAYLAGILAAYSINQLTKINHDLSLDTQINVQIETMLALESQLHQLQMKSKRG